MRQMKIFLAVLSFGTFCFCQDVYERPEFPDVFQTEIQGVFIKEKEIVQLDGALYYDRDNNRAAYRMTTNGETTTSIYNFNSNEIISIDGNDCVVDQIADNPQETFFPFTVDKQKKKTIVGPDEILYFSKSKLDRQELSIIPMMIFTATIDIPAYGRTNCEVMHMFSKPDVELPTCKENQYCKPTLLSISVKCKSEKGAILVDHVYSFYRFTEGIVHESVFLPPAGVYCNMESSKAYPAFPSYYSFSFDVVEKLKQEENLTTVFNTHREFYYEEENKLIRIDEFDGNGLLASSRVYDLQAETTFMIVPVVNKCYILEIKEKIEFSEITRLPKMFFQNKPSKDRAVHVGKRTVNGLTYEVWSFMWTDKNSAAKVVEDVYFLEIIPELKGIEDKNDSFLQISHADTYTYSYVEKDESMQYDLTLLRHIIINNYRTSPKELNAFDVLTCFNRSQRRDFYMKVKGTDLVKESQAHGEVIEHLYNKITAVVGISVLRISELTGDFDGSELIGIKGSILEATEESGWGKTKQPGMDETFELMKKAASQGKLSVTYKREYSTETTFTVISVEDLNNYIEKTPDCYSGGSMAAASLVLLLLGMFFGVAGYYIFLKKRKPSTNELLMENIVTQQ